MNCRITIFSLCSVLLLGTVLSLPCQAQVRVIKKTAEAEGERAPRIFVTNREAVKLLNRAKSRLEKNNYQHSLAALQRLLEMKEDSNFYSAADQGKILFRSLKGEVLRLIDELPPEGQERYQSMYAGDAKQLLEEARKSGDVKKMESLVRRYFHTPSGYDATWWLGNRHFDRSEPLAAALFYERLRKTSRGAKRFEPMLTLKTAICWGRAGMPKIAIKKLVELKQSIPKGRRLIVGGVPVALFEQKNEALGWMVKLLGEQEGFAQLKQEQWTLFRGNSSRNGISSPAAPVWDAQWKISTILEKRLVGSEKDRFEKVEKKIQAEESKRRTGDGLLGIGVSHPLIVGQYVIYRSLRKIRAVHLYTGKPLWETVTSSPVVEKVIRFNQVKRTSNRQYGNYGQLKQPLDDAILTQRTWRDMTLGTLSSNDKYVFAIDDVGVVNVFTRFQRRQENPLALKKYNRLRGFELTTGKFKWEIGGPQGEGELEGAGLFFLGAPLPFGKLLFCIAEQDGEIQLVAIEPKPEEYDAKIVWRQPLILPPNTIKENIIRRMSGLSPSYQDGVMVCPTSSGAVVAVDLSQRLLLWGYRYQTRTPQFSGLQRLAFIGGRGRNSNNGGDRLDQKSRWLDSAPTMAEGKVLLTPRDSNQLHCLNLLDGTVQWAVDRKEGLYLAGVYEGKAIVVGKFSVDAYRLDNGKPAWQESTPIPLPSGRGYQTEGLYHVPLSTGAIATIDLKTGRLIVNSNSRNGTIPGNLVVAQGVIVSQSATELSAYRSLSELNKEVGKQLAINKQDSFALSTRGELRLHHGDVKAGIGDLKNAIKSKLNPRAQTVLAEMILDGLRSDFAKYQAYSADMEKLIVDPEQKSRFLQVYADGLWKSGDQLGAVKKYLELAGPSAGKLRLLRIDGLTSVRSDRWLQSRLKKVYSSASPQKQQALRQLMRKQYLSFQAEKDLVSLRKFVQCFDGLPVAEEAQLQLAKKLDSVKKGLELEFLLSSLRKSNDKKTAGYATARLTELFIQQSRPSQIRFLFDQLKTHYAEVVCLHEKNGKELATAWETDKKVIQLLIAKNVYPPHYKTTLVKKTNRSVPYRSSLQVPVKLDPAGTFAGKSLTVNNNGASLVAKDEQGNELWTVSLRENKENKRRYFLNHSKLYFAQILDNLLLFYSGDQIFAINLSATSNDKRLLWKKSLLEEHPNIRSRPRIQKILQGGKGRIGRVERWVLQDQTGRFVGRLGPVTSDVIIYQQGDKIFGVAPLSGELLWKRSGFDYGCEMIGNNEKLIVIAPGHHKGIFLSSIDGERLGTQTVPEGGRLHAEGSKVVVIINSKKGNQKMLIRYDFATPRKKALWFRSFPSNVKFKVLNNNIIASLDPEGYFHIFSLEKGESILKDKVEVIKNLNTFMVLTSKDRYLLMMSSINRRAKQNVLNVIPNNHGSDILIEGNIYAYLRSTGKRNWKTPIEHSGTKKDGINPLQQSNTPFILLSSKTYKSTKGQRTKTSHRFSILDRRNGKILYRYQTKERINPLMMSFYTVKIDKKTKKIEFIARQGTVALTPVMPPVKAKKP